MNINKLFMVVIFLVLCAAFSTSWAADDPFKDQQAWVSEADSEVLFTYLESTMTVTIKNTNDHVQYFKISQAYYQTDPPIYWRVMWTDPAAYKMIKYQPDIDSSDYGWKIEAGETKTVKFKLVAYPYPTASSPVYIYNGESGQQDHTVTYSEYQSSYNYGTGSSESTYITIPLTLTTYTKPDDSVSLKGSSSVENNYWSLLNEPGLQASWFLPNEIEYLNPSLDLVSWKGHFCFWIKNMDTTSPKVSGIVRAPIVPIDSNLTYSNPQITYTDKEVPWANTAAWDVTLYPGQSKHYSYTYKWPENSNSTYKGSASSASYNIPTTAAASTNATVPTSETGLPFGLFVVAAVIIAGGVTYAKFFRKNE